MEAECSGFDLQMKNVKKIKNMSFHLYKKRFKSMHKNIKLQYSFK